VPPPSTPVRVIPGGAKRREGDPAVTVDEGCNPAPLHEPDSSIPFPSAASRLQPGMTWEVDELQ